MESIQNYEDAVKQLEQIIQLLEKGDLALEKSLELFQKGVELSAYCNKKLEETEKQIIRLMEEKGECKEVIWDSEAQK